MGKLEYIIKAIDEDIKCRAVAQAEKIGNSGRWVDNDEEGNYKLIYDDGTELTIDYDDNIIGVKYPNSDFDANYLMGESYTFFNGQEDSLFGDDKDARERIVRYCGYFASWKGWRINEYLRGLRSHDSMKDSLEEPWSDNYEVLWGKNGKAHKEFCDVIENNDLSKYDDFFSLRKVDRLHDNDNKNKRIVWDKGHTCSSVGLEDSDFDIFAGSSDAWRIITLHKKGNKASKGLFMGNLINEGSVKRDWEMEMHYAPNQKFRRLIIDNDRHVIVQEPYEA